MNLRTLTFVAAGMAAAACGLAAPEARRDWSGEVIYHVMPRSFFDSNGDRHGDLRGLAAKLDYLQELGVTAILCSPLCQSDFYHNYFPTDYERIDPEYGTREDYLQLVREVHRRGMRFILDMETQYVQGGNRWFEDSYGRPGSPFSDFILYRDKEQKIPEQLWLPSGTPLTKLKGWPDVLTPIVHLNLNHPRVRKWMEDYYASWVDPNGDGKFDDGVDGFRIDHIMDDLDGKGVCTGLYDKLWRPVFARCRAINPDLFVVGEQADWNDAGEKMITASGADAAFGFKVRFAIVGAAGEGGMFDRPAGPVEIKAERIHASVREALAQRPEGKQFVLFIENHDLPRWSSLVEGHAGRLRLGAVLNLALPGIPSVYSGQELGVTGRVGDWGTDANHLPVREAFPWTPEPDAAGTAVFYRGGGPWWDQSYFQKGGAKSFALSIERADARSLWQLYRQMIALRRGRVSLQSGDYQPLLSGVDGVMAFSRSQGAESTVVLLNLTDRPVVLARAALPRGFWRPLAGSGFSPVRNPIELAPHDHVILGIN